MNWISAIRQILVIVAIELRDVLSFQGERASATTLFSLLVYLGSGPNSLSISRQRIKRSVLNIYRLDFYDHYRSLSGVLIEYYGTL